MTVKSPFMDRGNVKDKGRHGRKAESLVSKRLGGRLQPGSGALDGAKADYKKDTPTLSLLIENKATTGKSMGLQRDWLLKVYQEAMEQNRTPALSLQFTNEAGLSEKRERWVMLPEHIFKQLVEGDL